MTHIYKEIKENMTVEFLVGKIYIHLKILIYSLC